MKQLFSFLLALVLSTSLISETLAETLVRDAEIEHTLRAYGDPIFKAAGVKPSSVHIFIVEEPVLNSYVAGGANMFIYTGLIEVCDTPDMLIGVMAHETGHIAGGHLAQGTEQLKNAQMGTILSFVLGAAAAIAARQPGAGAAVIAGGQTTVGRNFIAFTRAHEEAADQSALTSLDKLGISAEGLLKVFALLQRNERQHPGSPDPYLLTHPLTAERIDFVREHVNNSKIPEGQYPHEYDMMHKRMVAKLYGFLESPEKTFQKYPLSDHSVPARMAHAIAYYKMPELDKSIAEMDSLLKDSPHDPFFNELKGQILFENGHVPEALISYQQAIKYEPNSPLLLTDLAKVELTQNPPLISSATTHLESATMLDGDNPDSWHVLALAYGKAGNTPMSHLALAEEAILVDNPKVALSQAIAAISGLKEGPARQRAQDIKTRAIEMRRDEKDENH